MANEYFSDNEIYVSHQPLPSPSDTPYHSMSRRTSRYGTPLSEAPSTPAPFPPDPIVGNNDEKILVPDSRRFTPETLHASLVGEILNLRRELESKDKCIEDLETSLQTTQNENDALTGQLSSSSKETRAVKRQLQQLENGTIAALEEMVEERDKTKETNADLRQKLEEAQKKLRGQDDDSTRVHDMWTRDKETWEGEKRLLERRVHVSESRLKMLLDELATHEGARDEGGSDSECEGTPRDSGVGQDSDTGSVQSSPRRRPSTRIARHSRNLSNASYRSVGRAYRMSLMSVTGFDAHGLSLADELAFDEEEEDMEDLELDSDDFPENEMRARRALESRQSMRQDDKAKRILGLSLESDLPSNTEALPAINDCEPTRINESTAAPAAARPKSIQLIFPPTLPQYIDRGVQFSPPPSPVRSESAQSTDSAALAQFSEKMHSIMEIEANQSRKRVSVEQLRSVRLPSTTTTSTQTADQPLSPPDTPKVLPPAPPSSVTAAPKPEVASISTQTDPIPEPEPVASPASPKRAPPPVPIPIPSIAIHAPSSAPPSPKEPVLPPGTKSIGTQTSGDLVAEMVSAGTQTDPIRVDKRLNKLPLHLQPSSITSRPNTPEVKRAADGTATTEVSKFSAQVKGKEKVAPLPSARQDLMALLESMGEQKVEDRYPGNNDNGPLSPYDKDSILSRPFRTSSLFAGFEGPSSDEEDLDLELSDDDFSIPRFSARNVKSGRIFNNPPTPVPEDKEVLSAGRPSEDSFISSRYPSDRSSFDNSSANGKLGLGRTTLARQPSVRRSAMIHSGTSTHMRSRSPSQSSIGSSIPATKPPFPVPTRSSSRNVPFSKSEGSQSPTPRSSGIFGGRRPYGTRPQRRDSVRKVRSAATVQKASRSRSRSPQIPSTPVMAPSPEPPLPTDSVTGHRFGQRPQLSRLPTNTSAHTDVASQDSAAHEANVVDAIAATMVGEWMWKYTRKRKAFGGSEATSPADLARAGDDAGMLTGSGVRHKRWVWISPYERSILWSSKQPTTQSALIGKAGRKLVIQSVLDVTDNTPMPKNAGSPLFNRSILILTPARALKFTASTRERHYLWLTALSFLAHSGAPVPELVSPMPPVPPQAEETSYKPAGAILRRSHVRDSVRLAKDKANPIRQRYAAKLEPMPDLYPQAQHNTPVPDSADPPIIPCGPYHGRKRSSTGPGAPPPSVPFRSFSAQNVPSLYSSNSSDVHSVQPPSVPSSVYNPQSVLASTRTSEASTATRQHFFDSMGTVRMEAFIDNSLNERPAVCGRRAGRRRGSSQRSNTTDSHRGGGFYDDFTLEPMDQFRGF